MASTVSPLPQGDTRMGMTEIVKTYIPQVRLGSDPGPEAVQPDRGARFPRARRREYPSARPRQLVENLPGRLGEPDGSGSRLAVAQEETSLPVVGPLERQDLALAASGQQEKAGRRDLQGPLVGVCNEACRQTAYLVVGQEPFASPPAIAPDAPARIGTLGPQAHSLRLPHNDGEHRHRPVRGDRRRAQRRKPVPHLLPVDVGDGASGEIRQDLVPEVSAVHTEGSRLPDPLVVPEHGLGDGLEEGFVGPARHILPPADRGQHLAGAASRFPHVQRPGIADDFPDAFASMLAVDEKAFAARGQHPDAEALELGVSDVEGRLAWKERPHTGHGEGDSRHACSPGCGCSRGTAKCQIGPAATK